MTVRIEKRPGAEREDRTPERIQSTSSGAIGTVTGVVKDAAGGAIRAVKPRLRGWIHAFTAPLALAACIVLTVLAPGPALTWACAAYLACSLFLFANSGVYHISYGHWPRRVTAVLQRVDHANIYLLVLGIVWGGALAGIITSLAWRSAPRWLTTLFYILLGWVAIWFLPQFWMTGGPAIVWLLVSGGVVYTVGGVVYARRWPDPDPRWFGFHEIFHTCTVAAWACQCTACYLAVLG